MNEKPLNLKFPSQTTVKGKSILYDKNFRKEHDVVLACNDVKSFVKDVPDESVMLVVTSPPYNIGKPYEERIEFKEYLKWQKGVIEECVRILAPRGSICWEVGNYIENGEVFPLDVYFYRILKNLKFKLRGKQTKLKMRNKIIWRFGHGLHAQMRFSGRYETILWFTKSDDYIFNLDEVRVQQKYPGKRAYKEPNKGKPTSNPLGKNPSDIWDIITQDWNEEIWNIPNVKSNHVEKTVHPCQFPVELVERLVLALTKEHHTVLDPFAGVGSSIIAAILHNRKAIGVDKEKMYTDIAHKRIIEALGGTLRKRPLGKPVYKPRGTEKVARVPAEWINKSLDS